MLKQADLSLYIGIDLGTSGCRAIAIDNSDKIKSQANFDYPDPKQQTPQSWWQATQNVLQQLFENIDPQQVKAISVDGTSSTVLLCDDSGKALTPALMYHEQRATQQSKILQQHAPTDSIVLSPSSSLAKVIWLVENHTIKNDFHIVHQADWIAGKLCHRFNFSDVNNVLKMGFDTVHKKWPSWLLALFSQLNIKHESLARVFLPGDIVETITASVAKEFNLPLDVKIVAGTTDSTAAFIASGASKVGQAVTSLGSTLVLKVISDKAINSPEHGVYSQPYGKHWLVGGASNSGGAVLRHYFSDEQMRTLTKQLKPETATNLNYYPLLKKGERFPINDANLTPRLSPKVEDKSIFFQGLLEGIAEIEHTGYKLLQQLGAPYPSSIQTNGGGAVNKTWQQIRIAKLNTSVTMAVQTEAAYGSALLAKKAFT